VVGGASVWIAKGRPEAEQEAAWKFVKFLVEPTQQAEWYAGSGYFPIRRDAFDDPKAQEAEAQYPYLRVAPTQLQEGARNTATQGFLLGPSAKARTEAVATAIESMILTGTPPDEAIERAASEATELIEDYNRRIGIAPCNPSRTNRQEGPCRSASGAGPRRAQMRTVFRLIAAILAGACWRPWGGPERRSPQPVTSPSGTP
jgi:hypothetical protein